MSIFSKIKQEVSLEGLLNEACGSGDRRGRATFFSAPWRSDSSASLAYYEDDSPNWYDYGEGVGGDVIDFVVRWKSWKKGQAIQWLKQRAGLSNEADPPEEQVERYERREKLRDALTLAARWFAERWQDSDDTKALREELLEHYGWTSELAETLMLGLVPIYTPEQSLWDHLSARGIPQDILAETRLFVAHAGRQRCEGRLAFPYWRSGKVIYFAFRETRLSPKNPDKDRQAPKYVKLQEGDQIKNPAFWAWDPRPRTERPKREWTPIAEGVADAISVAMLGLPVASPVTTTFSRDDLKILKGASERLGRFVLLPDQESNGAGMKGAISTAVALGREGVDVRIAILPHEPKPNEKWKVDANDYIKGLLQGGASIEEARGTLEDLCTNAPPVLDLLVGMVPASARGAELTELLKPIGELLSVESDDLELDRVATELNSRLGRGAPKKVIVETLKKLRTEGEKKKKTKEKAELPEGGFERGDHVEIAERLITELGGAESVVFDDGEMHRYSSELGVWEPIKVAELHGMIGKYAGLPRGAEGQMGLSRTAIKGSREQAEDTVSKPGWFRAGHVGFAFKNGFVTIAEDGSIDLVSHDPKHRAVFRYDFDWDPERVPRKLIEFYSEVFRGDPEASIKTQFLLEFYGASLIGEAWRAGKAIIKYGPGNDGKSVETQIMQAVFPSGSLAAVSPHVWENDQMIAKLAGKLLNYAGELSAKELRESAIIKAVITGRDPVTGKVVYRPPFDFYARCGQVMTVNPPLPAVSDVSRGFWRRWEIVEFTRSFEPHEENARIVEDVTEDMQGIAVTLVKAAAQYVGNGYRYTQIPGSSELLRTEWMTGSEPVRRWINEQCIPAEPGRGLTADMLWREFRRWSTDHGHAGMSSATFRGRVTTIVRDLARTNPDWAAGAGDHVSDVRKQGFYVDREVESEITRFPIGFRLDMSSTEDAYGNVSLG